jgi:curved DNA-binding protein CbpA
VHPEWEEEAGTSKRAENGPSEEMNRAHALEVLGLSEGAERADIIAAHRDLMRKLHPDRGGNDYLAKKVNAAKDFLLE